MQLTRRSKAAGVDSLANTLFEQSRRRIFVQLDHTFAIVLLMEWAAAIVLAVHFRQSRMGAGSNLQWALELGVLCCLIPSLLAWCRPGATVTRYAIAIGQMICGILLTRVAAGLVEPRFPVFCSLAMLAFYRDWTVLAPATLVVLVNELLGRHGVAHPYDSGEHLAWVLLADTFMVIGCLRSRQEMWRSAASTAEIRRSTAVMSAVKESALDCILTLDEIGRVMEWNPAAEHCFGRDALNKTRLDGIGQILSPADKDRVSAGIEAYLRDGSTDVVGRRLELTGVHGEARGAFAIELALVAVHPVANMPANFLAYIRDVTERREAEAQVLLSTKLAMVASRTDNAVIITDCAGHIEWVNEGFSRITGYEFEEVIGARPGKLLQGPETDPETIDIIRQRILAGVGGRSEIVNYSKSGRRYWLSLDIQPIRDGNGTITNFIAIESDVTERKHAEATLQRNESLLRSLIHAIPDVICYTDTDNGYLGCNRAFEQFAGRPASTLLGMTDAVLQNAAVDGSTPQMASPEGGQREQWVKYPDGRRILFDTFSTPFADADGNTFGFIGISRDITQRKQTERLMLDAKDAADEAREAALAASRAKSEFLANMSHEIRTPLNGVIGMIELIDSTHLTAQQRQYAGLMRSSADALLSLINDILDFSKIEAGKLELDSVDFSLQETIENAVQMLAPRATKKKLELASRIDPVLGQTFRGDPDRLRQLIFNLVNNAVKFTDSGAVTVVVTPEPEGMENAPPLTQFVRVEVSDTGIGIPPERLHRLFKSFSQVDASTTRRFGGTGLGLAICKQLCELMGGQIGVRSTANKGSTFWFTLRLATVESNVVPPVLPVDLRGMSVLLVDPVTAHARTIAEMLLAWDLKPVLAANAVEARDALQFASRAGMPINLVICEMQLPDATGSEFVTSLTRDKAMPTPRVLAMYAVNKPLTHDEAKQLGFAAAISKPLRQSVLFDLLICTAHETVSSNSEPASVPVPASAVVAKPKHSGGMGELVLIADDNEINQMVAAELIKRAGYTCEVVGDGRAAAEAVGSKQYAAVLMDCQMPEMDGFEATRAIRVREAGTGRHVPVIALTANAIKGDRELCLSAGMDDYLSKPLKPEELFAKLKKWTAPKSIAA